MSQRQRTAPEAFGFNAAAFGLGFVLGPVLSLLAQQVSLGAAFLVSGAIALIALIITIFFLPESLPAKAVVTGNLFDLGTKKLNYGSSIAKGRHPPNYQLLDWHNLHHLHLCLSTLLH
jgi:MFS family permease